MVPRFHGKVLRERHGKTVLLLRSTYKSHSFTSAYSICYQSDSPMPRLKLRGHRPYLSMVEFHFVKRASMAYILGNLSLETSICHTFQWLLEKFKLLNMVQSALCSLDITPYLSELISYLSLSFALLQSHLPFFCSRNPLN